MVVSGSSPNVLPPQVKYQMKQGGDAKPESSLSLDLDISTRPGSPSSASYAVSHAFNRATDDEVKGEKTEQSIVIVTHM